MVRHAPDPIWALAFAALACNPRPIVPAEQPGSTTASAAAGCPKLEPPPPPPPPPPKCESLEEACAAGADTRVAVVGQPVEYLPPGGWHYARSAGFVLARSPEGNATLAFTLAASDERDGLVGRLRRLIGALGLEGVDMDGIKGRLRRPQQELKDGAVPIRLWEVDAARQAGTPPSLPGKGPGTLLVIVSPLADGRAAVGAAFVVSGSGDAEAPRVMESLQSLRIEP